MQIDHSIVESFGGEGVTCITARVYPKLAVDKGTHLYAFNNGTQSVKISRLSAWSMKQAQILPIQKRRRPLFNWRIKEFWEYLLDLNRNGFVTGVKHWGLFCNCSISFCFERWKKETNIQSLTRICLHILTQFSFCDLIF